MTTRSVIALELRRLTRSPGVWIAALGFGLVVVAGVSIPHLTLDDPSASVGAAFLLGPGTDLLLPLIVIVFTYGAVATHRERGSIHVLLSAPVDRRGVFVGLLLSRVIVLLGITACGLVAGVAATIGLYGLPPGRPVIVFSLLTLCATIVFCWIGVGVSASLRRPIRVLSALVGGFIIAQALWSPLVSGLFQLSGRDATSRLAERITMLSPLEAYTTGANGVLPPSPHLDIEVDGSEAGAIEGELVGGEIATLDLTLAFGVLAGWAVLLVLIGYLRFERAEIE